MQIKQRIQILAENLQKVTRQKFIAIREGDHKQAQNLHGMQLELDLQLHLLEAKLPKNNSASLAS